MLYRFSIIESQDRLFIMDGWFVSGTVAHKLLGHGRLGVATRRTIAARRCLGSAFMYLPWNSAEQNPFQR